MVTLSFLEEISRVMTSDDSSRWLVRPLAEAWVMFFVYVLKSSRNLKRYVGFTSKNPAERLKEHNLGSNKFTRRNRPFTLVYTESFDEKTIALGREIFLKSGQGRKFLDSLSI